MAALVGGVDELAQETGFSGVVGVDLDGVPALRRAYGYANRAAGLRNEVTTQLGVASGSKGLTALTVASLVEDGTLTLDTPARSLLRDDLPLVGDVTLEQLLGHTSGIGDYLDEDTLDDINAHVLPVPVHLLATIEAFLPVLDGHPPKSPPGSAFSYCNGGYVVLALVAERAAGVPFHDLVAERVCGPAGMTDTEYLRSDELPGSAALGYLAEDGLRTNLLHLPVRGTGDGGAYSTVDDVHRLWAALFAGDIVEPALVRTMTTVRSTAATETMHYGLGFWISTTGAVLLEGYDAGVSFRSTHDPARGTTATVMSNTSEGAWPIVRHLADVLSL
jgi:CubicO group peptidase (beta-lactamase class C family)